MCLVWYFSGIPFLRLGRQFDSWTAEDGGAVTIIQIKMASTLDITVGFQC